MNLHKLRKLGLVEIEDYAPFYFTFEVNGRKIVLVCEGNKSFNFCDNEQRIKCVDVIDCFQNLSTCEETDEEVYQSLEEESLFPDYVYEEKLYFTAFSLSSKESREMNQKYFGLDLKWQEAVFEAMKAEPNFDKVAIVEMKDFDVPDKYVDVKIPYDSTPILIDENGEKLYQASWGIIRQWKDEVYYRCYSNDEHSEDVKSM